MFAILTLSLFTLNEIDLFSGQSKQYMFKVRFAAYLALLRWILEFCSQRSCSSSV